MQIQITGKHIETGDALRKHVEEQVEAGISKYFERGAEVNVTFSKQGHAFRSDCIVHLDSGLRVQASGDDTDVYACFEKGLVKIEKQLRRYKRRLKNHHADKAGRQILNQMATEHTLASEPDDSELPEEYQPVTVAETPVNVPKLSVSDAVMQMELAHIPFLIFRNAAHGNINIVHRRDDGHIGWIDIPQDLPQDK